MRSLVRRYITNEQRTMERQRGVTEDDCNEIKQDISALRFELIELLGGRSNMANPMAMHGKRGRKKERRLMKGLYFNQLFMDTAASFDEEVDADGNRVDSKSKSPTRSKFARLARGLAGKRGSRGNKWKQLIEATRSKVIPFSRSSESVNSIGRGSGTRPSIAASEEHAAASPDNGRFDANTKRSLFARKVTSLLQEESQSLENESDINEAANQEASRATEATNLVTLPVPTLNLERSRDSNATRSPSSTGSRRTSPRRPSPSRRSPQLRGSSAPVNQVIGLTHSRSRNEWI